MRNLRVSAKALHRLRKHLVASDLEERLATPGMDPRRADLSVAGSVLFDTIIRRLGADSFTLCDLALREGIVLDYIHRNSARIRKVERYPDVRRRSIVELGERCGYWSEHAHRSRGWRSTSSIRRAACTDSTDREREWLEYGALLHDVGVHISYERHHRHSYYLIKNGDLRGFDPQEIEVIALIARYHRQATPKKSHEGYGDLKGAAAQDRASVLSAMVRLAEGLDRSHAQALAGIDLYPRGDDYLARLRTTGDAELELWAAHRHVAPLEDMLGKPIRFEVASNDYQERSRRRAPALAHRKLMLNNLTTRHEYPGKLFVVEGIDGSGKTTQLALLAKWLSAAGHPVFVTEWNSSALVKAATKSGKKKNSLTPMTFSLLHATDFADRLLYNIIPPLKAGMIVLADRYAYTAFSRDAARGCRPALGARALQLCRPPGPCGVLPRADRGLDRSPAGPARQAEVLRSGPGHGLEQQRDRELQDVPGQGARRIRPHRRRVRAERHCRERQHHGTAADLPQNRFTASGDRGHE